MSTQYIIQIEKNGTMYFLRTATDYRPNPNEDDAILRVWTKDRSKAHHFCNHNEAISLHNENVMVGELIEVSMKDSTVWTDTSKWTVSP